MRIGINTLFESPITGTGGLLYIRELVRALSAVDRENEYVVFVSPLNRHIFEAAGPNFISVLCPISKEKRLGTILFEHTVLPLLVRKHRLDVLHSPGNIAPLWVPAASVVTVHTIHHYIVPKMIARSSLVYRRALMPRTLRRAERIITISDFVRHSVHRLLGIPCDRMVTVYHGVQDSSGNGHLPHDPQLPSKYILFVSALWPYKNAVRLVEAFALLKREQIEHKLVMVGGGWESCRREVESVAREKGVREEIILTGRVPDVWNYYRHADVFVYPSLHEEFGMPVLEAMLAGVPVVTSNRGSLPEIAGGAAVITDVEHPSEIAGALKRVLSDRALRTELVARGRTRAANFTWEKTARQTVQAYGDAHERRKRQGTQSSGGRQPKRLAGMPK